MKEGEIVMSIRMLSKLSSRFESASLHVKYGMKMEVGLSYAPDIRRKMSNFSLFNHCYILSDEMYEYEGERSLCTISRKTRAAPLKEMVNVTIERW